MYQTRRRQARPVFLAVLAVVLAGTCPVAAAAGDWTAQHSGDGVSIHTRSIDTSGVEQFKGTMDVPWTPEEVATVIFDVDAQRRYLVGIKEIKVLGETTTSSGKVVRTIYQLSAHPPVDDREVVLKSSMWSTTGKKGTVWHVAFKRQKFKGTAKDGVVQVSKLEGGWTISAHPSGKGSRIVYRCHAEIGGNVPDFMVNAGQVDNLLGMLTNVRAELKAKLGAGK